MVQVVSSILFSNHIDMKKNFLFGFLALMLAWFWFGGISMAEDINCTYVNWEQKSESSPEAVVYVNWEDSAIYCYSNLSKAISAEKWEIFLLGDLNLSKTTKVSKNTVLNLNWHNINSKAITTFWVMANFEIKWNWQIKQEASDDEYSPVMISPLKWNIVIWNGVSLEWKNIIAIPDLTSVPAEAKWDISIDLWWEIKADGFWITINWNITNTDEVTINIQETANITSSNSAWLYLAWYWVTTIADWAEISWKNSAIEIRAWELTINWWTFTATAEWENVTVTSNSQWSTTVWAALAIAQHTTKQEINVTINWWTFEWIAAVNQANPQSNEGEAAEKVSTTITAGEFNWTINNTDSNNKINIEWWIFSDDVSDYTANDGYSVKNSEWEYEIKALTKTYFDMSSNKNITFPVVLSDDWKNVLLEETKAVLKKESSLVAWPLLAQFNDLTQQSDLDANAKIVTIEWQDLLFFKQALADKTQYKIWVFTKSGDTGPFSSKDKFIGNGHDYDSENPAITFDPTNTKDPFEVSSWPILAYNEVQKESKTVWYTLYTQVDPEDNAKNQWWFYAPRLYKVTFNTNWSSDTFEAQKVALTDWKATNPWIPTKGWVGFKFWSKDGTNEYNFEDVVDDDIELTAIYGTAEEGAFNIIFKNWDIELQKDVLAKDVIPTYLWETPTKAEDSTCNTYEFKEWTPTIAAVSADTTYTATFTCTSKKSSGGSSSWGGGSSRSSTTKTTTTTTTTWDAKTTTDTKATDTKTNVDGNNNGNTPAYNNDFSKEFNDAYQFAYKNWITTMPSIEEADMYGPLTRIAMAKMLSQYAINVLGKTPDTTKVVPTFPDVDAKLDADYNNWVTLAYQLWIMWINVNKYRPNDLVTRAEFGTALSRMLYSLSDGEWDQWYKTHLDKLMEEQIITNNNPNLQELRGYVMIMLMRSAQ